MKFFKARVARLQIAAPPRRVAVQKLREILGQFRTSFVRIFLKLCPCYISGLAYR